MGVYACVRVALAALGRQGSSPAHLGVSGVLVVAAATAAVRAISVGCLLSPLPARGTTWPFMGVGHGSPRRGPFDGEGHPHLCRYLHLTDVDAMMPLWHRIVPHLTDDCTRLAAMAIWIPILLA